MLDLREMEWEERGDVIFDRRKLAGDPLGSVEAFTDVVGRYDAVGITELVVHWPVPGSAFDHDRAMFEAIAAHHAGL